jgi:tetratricopeptide (TPR) repeat protein
MIRNAKFWILMTMFQVIFGLVVFAITRQYYIHAPDKVSADQGVTRQPAPEWPERGTENDLEQLISAFPGPSKIQDPVALSRQADEFFANGQYDQAANLYEQLLASGSNNVDTYNNLGITLYYLGRSTEALGVLNEGVAVDSTYQRIWLTLGFINSQLGNTEQARLALTTAVQMGTDTQVGQSAIKMLDSLP